MSIYTPIAKEGETRRVLALRSPIDLEPIGELVCANREDVQAAVARARAAQPDWAAKSFAERAEYMNRALKVLLARQDEIIDTVVRETGKARIGRDEHGDLRRRGLAVLLREERAEVPQDAQAARARPAGHRQAAAHRVPPLGVIGIITPWNGPFVLGMNPSVQALMAGNAVVLKGSEVTPYSTGSWRTSSARRDCRRACCRC